MPSVPSPMCQSSSLRKASRSRLPSSCIGVTIATRLPLSIAIYRFFLKFASAAAPLIEHFTAIDLRSDTLCDSKRRAGFIVRALLRSSTDALHERRLRRVDVNIFVGDHAQAAAHELEQLARLEQEIGVARAAVALVACRERLVYQDALRPKCPEQQRQQRPVQVIADDDARK